MPALNVSLKMVTAADVDVLLPLIHEFNRADGISTPVEVIRPALEKLLENSSLGRAWFVFTDEVCSGYCILTFGYDLEYGGRDAWMTDFYVRESYQRKGVATKALQMLEVEAKRLEICAVHLLVHKSNGPARRVYEKCGFEDHPRVAMMKLLRTS